MIRVNHVSVNHVPLYQVNPKNQVNPKISPCKFSYANPRIFEKTNTLLKCHLMTF